MSDNLNERLKRGFELSNESILEDLTETEKLEKGFEVEEQDPLEQIAQEPIRRLPWDRKVVFKVIRGKLVDIYLVDTGIKSRKKISDPVKRVQYKRKPIIYDINKFRR